VQQSTSPLQWRNGLLCNHNSFKRVQVVVNSIMSYGDILLHSKILLCTSAKFTWMLSCLQRGRIERWHGRSQKCERRVGAPRFWPLLRTTELLPWKQKCSGKIGIRACFEDRNDIFLAINKCKFLSSNIILWSKTNFVAMQINI
jgi:hypothetical protein